MATASAATPATQQAPPLTNGTSPSSESIELAIPLPNGPVESRIHIHLTILATTIILFVTTHASGAASQAPLGSYIFAMPDRYNPTQPLSTTLYASNESLDFATRLAKVLARRTGKSVHVGSSCSFMSAAEGGTVEEEMAGFRGIVQVVMEETQKAR